MSSQGISARWAWGRKQRLSERSHKQIGKTQCLPAAQTCNRLDQLRNQPLAILLASLLTSRSSPISSMLLSAFASWRLRASTCRSNACTRQGVTRQGATRQGSAVRISPLLAQHGSPTSHAAVQSHVLHALMLLQVKRPLTTHTSDHLHRPPPYVTRLSRCINKNEFTCRSMTYWLLCACAARSASFSDATSSPLELSVDSRIEASRSSCVAVLCALHRIRGGETSGKIARIEQRCKAHRLGAGAKAGAFHPHTLAAYQLLTLPLSLASLSPYLRWSNASASYALLRSSTSTSLALTSCSAADRRCPTRLSSS